MSPRKAFASPIEKDTLFLKIEDKYLKGGFYKTSMDTLAAELGVSKKTIYKYFPSKESIVEEIVQQTTLRVSASVDEIINRDINAIEKMTALLKVLTLNLLRFSERWLNDIRLHMPRLWARVDEFRTNRMNSALSVIIGQGKKEGLIIDMPNEIIITLLISSIRGVVNPDFLFYNKFSYDEALKLTFEILFNGILTQKGKDVFRNLSERNIL